MASPILREAGNESEGTERAIGVDDRSLDGRYLTNRCESSDDIKRISDYGIRMRASRI